MIRKIRNNSNAFTLVEIMIVVAIIGLLAALAIPGFVKARKQSQGRSIVAFTRTLDSAMEQVAMEKGLKDGDTETLDDVFSYLKINGSAPPAELMVSGVWYDFLQNPYTIGPVGTNMLQISSLTKSSLQGVGIDWGAY